MKVRVKTNKFWSPKCCYLSCELHKSLIRVFFHNKGSAIADNPCVYNLRTHLLICIFLGLKS